MSNINFHVPTSNPTLMHIGNLKDRQLVGLDGFLSKRISIKAASTETPESHTGNDTTVNSNCSNYCETSTCYSCC